MNKYSYIVALAAALVAAGLMAVPSAQAAGVCVDSVTAGGWVPDGGPDLFANFGLNAQSEDSVLTGELNFVDADMDCHVVGHVVISYTEAGEELDECSEDPGLCRTIVYDNVTVTLGEVPLEGVFQATVVVCDNGEGGNADPDFFSIAVVDVSGDTPVLIETCSVSDCLAGGDVQVHPSHGNCP